MKKALLITLFLILFIIFNYNNFSNYYYNYTGNYIKANNLEGKYNLATKYYIEKKYGESAESFSGILLDKRLDFLENKELLFRVLHNNGNNFYRLINSTNKNSEKIIILEKAIDNYEKAINIKTDEKTIKNLEFVKEKLKELKDKEEKESETKKGDKNKKQDNSEGQEKKGDKNKKGDNSEGQDKKGDKNENLKGQKNKGNENKKGIKKDNDSKEKGLSKESKKALEKQLEKLKNEQSKIGEYYNKNYIKNNKNDILEYFFSRGGNFDNGLLDEVEKDW